MNKSLIVILTVAVLLCVEAKTAMGQGVEVSGGLDITGTPGVDGITFPDNSMQTSAVNGSLYQKRVTGTCSSGYAIRAIDATGGVVTCQPVDSGLAAGTYGNAYNFTNSSNAFVGNSVSATASGSATGVQGSSSSGSGVQGASTLSYGVYGQAGGSYAAVYGHNSSNGPGVEGASTSGSGVQGTSFSAGSYGVHGNSSNGTGVRGDGGSYGVYGFSASGGGVYGESTNGYGVQGYGAGVGGVYGSSTNGTGVRGDGGTYGAWGNSASGTGVYGTSGGSGNGNAGVYGNNTSSGPGVRGDSSSGYGVQGYGAGVGGVYGSSSNGTGVRGDGGTYGVWGNSTGNGVYGSSINGNGVYGSSVNGWAGYFIGPVDVVGNLVKSSGSFKIDHPLDPANKYLYHSFVESPDMKNIYDGVVVLDANGEAWVTLPDWFEALNRDFRYQLTAMGAPFIPYIAEEIANNRFKIAGGLPGKKVSWQVTGIRQDAWANAHRIPVEEEKQGVERGAYIHPELFGQPRAMSIEYKRNPRLARKLDEIEDKH